MPGAFGVDVACLITGSRGSLDQELVRKISNLQKKSTGLPHVGDQSDTDSLTQCFQSVS